MWKEENDNGLDKSEQALAIIKVHLLAKELGVSVPKF